MSVLVKDRNKSNKLNFDVVVQAYELRLVFTTLLFRDFGVKDKNDVVRRKYKVHIDDLYPYDDMALYINVAKDKILKLVSDLSTNVTAANSIYPTNFAECDLRRQYQNLAITNCFSIITELQYIATVFRVDINKYTVYVDLLNDEIDRLKGWRKSDNKIRKKIEKQSKSAA